ncbi:MAG: SDR family oxidoreductase [Mucilaginibacter sp.]
MKTILITGGSGKVGFQLINHFLDNDFVVVTTTRDKQKFLSEKKDLLNKKHSTNLKIIESDFLEVNAVEKIINFLDEQKIKVQHIVHNARSLNFLKIEDDYTVTTDNFVGEYFVNVVFPYRLTMQLIKGDSQIQNVIFISSIYGVVASTPALYDDFHASSPIHYGVSKAAQIHLTKELAVRLSPKIRVNCISFGGIEGRANAAFIEKYSSFNPQGRMLKEIDVVAPVDFLVSEGAKNMTGQNVVVDGGWTIW